MTNNLTQKGMINTFANTNEGDFYWRLKYLRLRAIRNPEDETAFNAKHKRVLPILPTSKREHEYETLSLFLAYFSRKLIFSYFMGKGFYGSMKNTKNITSLTIKNI